MATLPAIQPLRVPDPLQGYAAVQNILASQQQQQVNALAMEKARREAEREAALTNYLTSANLSTPEGVAGLTRFGKPGLEYQTALGQAETARLTRAKTQADLITSKLAQGRQMFAMAPTPAALADAAKAQFSDPVLGPVLTRMNLSPDSLAAYIAQKSATPEGFAQVKLEFASTADQMVDQLKGQLQRFERGRLLGDETTPATPTAPTAPAVPAAAAAMPAVAPATAAAAPPVFDPGALAVRAGRFLTPSELRAAQAQFEAQPGVAAVSLPVTDLRAAPVNALGVPPAAPVSALVTPPVAPGVQVAGPAALPDTDARVADLRQRLRRATIAGDKAAVDVLKGELEDLTKVKTGGPEIFQLQERLDKLPLGSPRRAEIEARIRRLTEEQKGTTVKVELPPQPRAEQESRGKLLVEQYKSVSDAARLATRTLPTLEMQERILDTGFRTGFGAEAQKAGASLLSALGMPEAKDYATNAQAFSAAMSQAVLQKQLEQKGTQTKADADRIEQTGAQLTNTVDANRFIIAVARAQLKRDIAQRNFYDKWWKENKTYDGAEDAWATGEGNKSLFESPELKRFAAPAREPATAPAAAPAGAGPYSDPDKERRYQEWKAKQGAK